MPAPGKTQRKTPQAPPGKKLRARQEYSVGFCLSDQVHPTPDSQAVLPDGEGALRRTFQPSGCNEPSLACARLEKNLPQPAKEGALLCQDAASGAVDFSQKPGAYLVYGVGQRQEIPPHLLNSPNSLAGQSDLKALLVSPSPHLPDSPRCLDVPSSVESPLLSFVYKDLVAFASPTAPDLSPDTKELQHYSETVSWLHQQQSLLPCRFGCFWESEEALLAWLGQQYDSFCAQLQRLEGCAEMSIRLLLNPSSPPPLQPTERSSVTKNNRLQPPPRSASLPGIQSNNQLPASPSPPVPSGHPAGWLGTADNNQLPASPSTPATPWSTPQGQGAVTLPAQAPAEEVRGVVPPPRSQGAAYLAARAQHYQQQARFQSLLEQQARQCQDFFAPLSRASRKEQTSSSYTEVPLLSLYFLVPWQQVEDFRSRFAQWQKPREIRVLFSGPWPPYNFID